MNAIGDACGVTLDPQVVALRRLLYCGSGFTATRCTSTCCTRRTSSASPTSSASRATTAAGGRELALKKAGNRLMELVGGRSIHPINVRLGGFYSVPSRADMRAMVEVLRGALDDALATVAWVAGFDFPDVTVGTNCWRSPGALSARAGVIARRPARCSRSRSSATTSSRPGAALHRPARHPGRPGAP